MVLTNDELYKLRDALHVRSDDDRDVDQARVYDELVKVLDESEL